MNDHTSVEVDRIPNCDLCTDQKKPAYVDGKTVNGPWAYMCARHFRLFGCGLGLGKGQRLILREED